jgi:hypothetical protein
MLSAASIRTAAHPMLLLGMAPDTTGVVPILLQILFILGILGGLTLLLFIWAIYWRNPRRHRSRSRHRRSRHSTSSPPAATPHSDPPAADEDEGDDDDAPSTGHHRRRRRRRQHRPRNPSLSETGGLPPTRSEEAGPTQ